MRIFVKTGSGDFKAIARATSCSLHIALATEDSSTKDDTGDWAENEVVGKSWDVSTDCLVALDDPGSGGELPADILSLALNATKVTLKMDVTNGNNNRTATNSALKVSGEAYLQDWNATAANRQNSTLTCQFQGTGPLATT